MFFFWFFLIVFAVLAVWAFFAGDEEIFSLFCVAMLGAGGFFFWMYADHYKDVSDLDSGITYCVKSKRDDHQLVLGYRKEGEDRKVRTTSEYLEHGLSTECFILDERKKIHAVLENPDVPRRDE